MRPATQLLLERISGDGVETQSEDLNGKMGIGLKK
jgi:hypothetical protein